MSPGIWQFYGRSHVLPLALALLTAGLRLAVIDDRSITQDESTMVLFARGVLQKGYPFLLQNGKEFIISTYELIPYPIALSLYLFGFSEFSARLPAVLFSAATVVLLYRFSCSLYSWRVGLLAGLLYAVLPWSVYWGHNAFYPAQLQFFALIAIMMIYRLLSDTAVPSRYFYYTSASIICTYLSWEGAGFILPVFLCMALYLRWGQWYWITRGHGWTAVCILGLLITAQLTYRTVLREPYLVLGASRGDVSFLQLAFNKPEFDPFYYLASLFSDNHITLGISLFLGFSYLVSSWNLRFFYLLVGLSFFFLTYFLGYYSLRYVYYTLPIILLASAAVTEKLTVSFYSRMGGARVREWLGSITVAVLGLGHLVIASPWGISASDISESFRGEKPFELRHRSIGFSFRALAETLEQQYRQGDAVVVQAPFPYAVYTGRKGDYFLQAYTVVPTYLDFDNLPYYSDKWVGNPVLSSVDDVKEVFNRYPRVWMLFAPGDPSERVLGEKMLTEVTKSSKLVADMGAGKLYLWVNPRYALGTAPN